MAKRKASKPEAPERDPCLHSEIYFNLIDESWIPVVWKQETLAQPQHISTNAKSPDVSLRDTLLHAHEIVEVADPSPLVTAALHRLLIALVHAIYRGPDKRKEWAEMWQAGAFDSGKISDYFASWNERFWLFHPQRPFLQWPGDDIGELRPSTLLDLAAVSGNNATLFDHSIDSSPTGLTCPEAARQLLAFLTFTPGGFVDGVGGTSAERSALAAPWADGAAFFCQDQNLFGTLMMNLMMTNSRNGTVSTLGDPEWQRSTPSARTRPKQSQNAGPPSSYLGMLTSPCRHVRLCAPDSHGLIRSVHLHLGCVFKSEAPVDPAKAYYADKKRGWRPLALRADRSLWRDSASLLEFLSDEHAPPGALVQLASLRQHGIPAKEVIVGLRAFGTIGSQAKLDLWRAETLPIPISILANAERRVLIENCLGLAEDVETAVRSAIWVLVSRLVPRSKEEDERKALRDHLDVTRPFWTALETPFKRDVLGSLVSIDVEQVRRQWGGLNMDLARDVLFKTINGLAASGKALQGGAEAERILARRLDEVSEKHNLGEEE